MNRYAVLTVFAASLSAGCGSTTDLCVVRGKGAQVSTDELKKAIDEVNRIFGPAEITFGLGGEHDLSDPAVPEHPRENGEQETPDEKQVKEAGKKAGHGNKLIVIVIPGFVTGAGGQSSLNGLGQAGGPIIIVDPPTNERNDMKPGGFARTLGHELGHALGLNHKKLPSDRTKDDPPDAEYQPPNLMSSGNDPESTELTKDQIDELKKNAPKFLH